MEWYVGDAKALYIGSAASGVVVSGGSVANPAMGISGMEEKRGGTQESRAG